MALSKVFDAAWFITMANGKSAKTHMFGWEKKGGVPAFINAPLIRNSVRCIKTS